MTRVHVKYAGLVVAVVCLALSIALAGPFGLVGMVLGLGAASLGVYSLWLLTALLAEAAGTPGQPGRGGCIACLLLLVKLPLFFLLFMAANRLGNGSGTCFIVGIVVVYSLTVVWGLAR